MVNAGSTSLKLHRVGPDETAAQIDALDAVDAGELAGIGHRIVHGGERFREPVEIDDEVVRAIEELSALAPLQHPPALAALEQTRAAFPGVPQVAVFGTAFRDDPARGGDLRDPVGVAGVEVRRYGFHGLVVQWVAEQVGVPGLVTCHLGGGCSITAVLDGRSIDTTMGFSPLEGVPMASRSGSVDPGALIFLLRERGSRPTSSMPPCRSGRASRRSGPRRRARLRRLHLPRRAGRRGHGRGSRGLDVIAFSGGVGENRPDVATRSSAGWAFSAASASRSCRAQDS